MNHELLMERFFEVLINGDRPGARALIEEASHAGYSPRDLVTDLFWPTYELVQRLYREDQLTTLAHRLSTRLLRVLVDQTASRLGRANAIRRSVFAFCGPSDADELGAQMAVDILESEGFAVTFAGGGIATDEIIAATHERRPGILLMFSSAPQDLPTIREVIDRLREIGACPNTQIAVGGGVFNRAEGLAEEIGADIWADDPLELAEALVVRPAQRAVAEQRTVGRNRRAKAA